MEKQTMKKETMKKETMKKETKTFYKKCPVKKCNTISGFYLNKKQIDKNEKYYCQECDKERKLSSWGISNEDRYKEQIANRKIRIELKKLDKKKIIPANKRKYGRQ